MAHRDSKKVRFVMFCIVMMLGAFLLVGCAGDDGAKGETGDTGPAGPEGPQGPPGESVTATAETCTICHTEGKIADIAVAHPDPTGEDVVISAITLSNAGGVPVVAFHVETADGTAVTDIDPAAMDSGTIRLYISDLVPAGTIASALEDGVVVSTKAWDSDYFERWAYERNTDDWPDFAINFANDGGGDYTYTFTTTFAEATVEAPEYDETDVQRVIVRLSGEEDEEEMPVTNNTAGIQDFDGAPADGASAGPIDAQRLFVTAAACKQCHGPLFEEAAHAGGYLDTRACVMCHSPIGHYGAEMQEDDAHLSVLIHKIHAAIPIEAFEDRIRGFGYEAVSYPQDIRECVVCHTDSGLDLGTGDEIDNWKTHPTMEICVSCHIDVNFATGENHDGGPQTDNGYCNACHLNGTSFSKSVVEAHDTTLTGMNAREFNVTINMTGPANPPYYVEGETPMVTVTLASADGGPAANYTAAQDDEGNRDGNLSGANLFVYGPRAKAVPVLTLGSTTDPAYDPESGDTPSQGHGLFVGTDDQVMTDSAGFKYQLLAIPADMEPGTYMVRFEGADYGGVSDDDYVTSSSGVITFQVGTGDEEAKVAGDSCYNCHGDTRMHLTGSHAHNAAFNTDECLACHDQSGNYAIPIANRVHAVHSANSGGDIFNIEGGSRDWSEVTFPRDIKTCVACHDSGAVTYKTLPYMMPCAGCHAGYSFYWDGLGSEEALSHMIQNGGPYIPESE